MGGITRRLAGAATTWVVTLGVVAIAVHPEPCNPATPRQARLAAERAVAWFGANVGDDGRFIYRYDRGRDTEEGGYNDPRHAGVLWSLYQAESAGIEGSAAIAESGLGYVDPLLVETSWGTLFGRGSRLSIGSTALLVGALDERRTVLERDDRDDLLRSLGDALVASVNDDGAVDAFFDRVTGPIAGSRERFFTGEVMWALSRLELTFPGEGYGNAALSVRRYLIEDRDEIERPVPQLSDHWAAYGWETMSRWPDPPSVGPVEASWLERQLGLFGLQVRYESQRVGGITKLTRGTHALGAGVGTLGEAIGNYLAADARDPFLSDDERADLAHRGACTAGLLFDRQATPEDAAASRTPEAIVGAWFRKGDTQMDDQQHALSALLLLEHQVDG